MAGVALNLRRKGRTFDDAFGSRGKDVAESKHEDKVSLFPVVTPVSLLLCVQHRGLTYCRTSSTNCMLDKGQRSSSEYVAQRHTPIKYVYGPTVAHRDSIHGIQASKSWTSVCGNP